MIFRFLCKLVFLNFFAKDSIRWSLLTIRGPHWHVAARDWLDFFKDFKGGTRLQMLLGLRH